MIVVTAPTDNMIVRDAAKLEPAVRDRVEVVEGSHGDVAVVDRAFAGASALFWLVPPDARKSLSEAYLEFAQPAVAAIRGHGIKRIVSVTALGRGTRWQENAGDLKDHAAASSVIIRTPTALRQWCEEELKPLLKS